MLNALERWRAQGWTTPIYHPRTNQVERRNQDLKKGLRAALIDDKHSTWDMKLAPILYAIRNGRNVYTGIPPLSVLALGKECKRPGDWELVHEGVLENAVDSEKTRRNLEVMGEPGKDRGTVNSKFTEGELVY
jgi:hydrogenase maturation factor